MSKEKIELLKASIEAEEKNIASVYAKLDLYPASPDNEEQTIVLAYYLHNLYTAFEQISQLVAQAFENQIDDPARWHSLLLRQMTLDVEGIRPRLFSKATYQHLNRLRRFRHVFSCCVRNHVGSGRNNLAAQKGAEAKVIVPR